ncbi:hypothetical protein M422DRAFT_243801 [Sphaerobolus stellatus SS14]|nr:hypothetical protein M422DRAFT_243801 [Sphaerobolus stellatus SS14]
MSDSSSADKDDPMGMSVECTPSPPAAILPQKCTFSLIQSPPSAHTRSPVRLTRARHISPQSTPPVTERRLPRTPSPSAAVLPQKRPLQLDNSSSPMAEQPVDIKRQRSSSPLPESSCAAEVLHIRPSMRYGVRGSRDPGSEGDSIDLSEVERSLADVGCLDSDVDELEDDIVNEPFIRPVNDDNALVLSSDWLSSDNPGSPLANEPHGVQQATFSTPNTSVISGSPPAQADPNDMSQALIITPNIRHCHPAAALQNVPRILTSFSLPPPSPFTDTPGPRTPPTIHSSLPPPVNRRTRPSLLVDENINMSGQSSHPPHIRAPTIHSSLPPPVNRRT